MVRLTAAFTLVELLVVISITALLIGILLPALSRIRDSARTVQCASNQRQIVIGLLAYASDFGDEFPPDGPTNAINWHDPERIGLYVPGTVLEPDEPRERRTDGIGFGVYLCPSDTSRQPGRSYNMNRWASSTRFIALAQADRMGEHFDASVPHATATLLMADQWANDRASLGFAATGLLGANRPRNTPGMRFARLSPLWFDARSSEYPPGTFGQFPSMLAYTRHGPNDDPAVPEGAINIGYVDGHVALNRHDDLYRWEGDRPVSTLDTLWSPADAFYEQQAAGGP